MRFARSWPALGIALALLAPSAAQAEAGTVQVTVTILRFVAVQDPDPFLGQGDGDFRAKVRIGPNEVQESGEIESSDFFPPDWRFTRRVSDSGPVEVEIRMVDGDTANPEDVVDLNPADDVTTLLLYVDPASGDWSGSVPAGQNVSTGDGDHEHFDFDEGGEAGRIFFDISLSGNGDIDGDGIPDGIERFGVRDRDGNLDADLAAMGADPCRRSVALEIDYMVDADHTHRPLPDAIRLLKRSFDGASVGAVSDCPYPGYPREPTGVDLVVDVDDAFPHADVLGTEEQFDAVREVRFDRSRRPYFHYVLFVHNLEEDDSTSGVCCFDDGDTNRDLIVSLGSWTDGRGDFIEQAGTVMHELGHALGLSHGGDHIGINDKPNYLSVMNYRYQFGIYDESLPAEDVDGDGTADGVSQLRVDYTHERLATIDETSLDEGDGIGDGDLYPTWRDGSFVGRSDRGVGALDWDGDGSIDAARVNVDISGDGICLEDGPDNGIDTAPADDDFTAGKGSISAGANGVLDSDPPDDSDDTIVGNEIRRGDNDSLDTDVAADDVLVPRYIINGPDHACDSRPGAGTDDVQTPTREAQCVGAGVDRQLESSTVGDDWAEGELIFVGDDLVCNTPAAPGDVQIAGVGQTEPGPRFTGFDDWRNIKYRAVLSPDAAGRPLAHPQKDIDRTSALALRRAMTAFFAQPPVADAGGPYSTTEGLPAVLDASGSTDPHGHDLSFDWDLDGDGEFDDATGVTAVFSSVSRDGEFEVGVRATDELGVSDTDVATVTVANVPPELTVSSDAPIDENSPVTVSGVATDVGADDPLSATVDWGDGTPVEPVSGYFERTPAAAVLTFTATHVYGDDSTYVATVCASDDDESTCKKIDLRTDNVAPTASIDHTGTIDAGGSPTFVAHAGTPVGFTGRSTDPGSDDLLLSWDWDDGAPAPDESQLSLVNPPVTDQRPSPSIQPRDASDARLHAFAAACLYDVVFASRDDDGGGASASVPVVITGNADATRSAGHWHHQYGTAGLVKLDRATLECYLAIAGHMSGVFGSMTVAQASAVLDPTRSAPAEKLDRQLLAAWLNFANGALDLDELVDTNGDRVLDATFGEAVAKAEAVRLNPLSTRAELEAQKDVLERINLRDR